MKIYATRVDAVHTDTYRMLGGLSRGQLDAEPETPQKKGQEGETGRDMEAEEEESRKRPARRGTDTLEANVENLNLKKIECALLNSPLAFSSLIRQAELCH